MKENEAMKPRDTIGTKRLWQAGQRVRSVHCSSYKGLLLAQPWSQYAWIVWDGLINPVTDLVDNLCREDETDESNARAQALCKLYLRYNSMLHLGYINENEMLVVEQPWLNVVATFPPALQRRVYGS